MKILQINVWGGRIRDGLTNFIANGDYDVVCMQEAVWDEERTDFLELFVDTVDKIKKGASFEFDFRSEQYGFNVLDGEAKYRCGIAILSKIPFVEIEEKVILEQGNHAISDHRYTAQRAVLENGLTVVNYHGYWQKDPLGNETSIKCMKSVAEMFKNTDSPVVMCGDLNLVSEASAMRELDFLKDLTAENKIKTTLRNIRFEKDVACDHILVSENVSYDNFEVINAPVSDHRALAIDIKI